MCMKWNLKDIKTFRNRQLLRDERKRLLEDVIRVSCSSSAPTGRPWWGHQAGRGAGPGAFQKPKNLEGLGQPGGGGEQDEAGAASWREGAQRGGALQRHHGQRGGRWVKIECSFTSSQNPKQPKTQDERNTQDRRCFNTAKTPADTTSQAAGLLFSHLVQINWRKYQKVDSTSTFLDNEVWLLSDVDAPAFVEPSS